MYSLRSAIIAWCFIGLTAVGESSSAGWGFPAYGAWAYGSDYGSFNSSYWAGYPRWSSTSFYRTSYRNRALSAWGHYSLTRVRSCYPRVTGYATTWSLPIVRTSFYYPLPYIAPVYFAPVYYDPSYFVVPPTCYQPAVYCAPDDGWTNYSVLPDYSLNYNNSSSSTQPMVSEIPHELLAAADALLQAGGYREAATAYAQLNVRYGSNNEIFTRRFVAQIAAGDIRQAAIVLASAQAAGFPLQPSDLPAGQLAALLPGKSAEVSQLTEKLASEALSTDNQLESMQMMGTWLSLSGDDSRAALFLAMADRLSSESQVVPADNQQLVAEELPTPGSKSEYTSLE